MLTLGFFVLFHCLFYIENLVTLTSYMVCVIPRLWCRIQGPE